MPDRNCPTRALGVSQKRYVRQGKCFALIHRHVGGKLEETVISAPVPMSLRSRTHGLSKCRSTAGIAAVLRRQCACSRVIAMDGDARDRTAGGYRTSGAVTVNGADAPYWDLKVKADHALAPLGVRRGGEVHAPALLDINGVSTSVEAHTLPFASVRMIRFSLVISSISTAAASGS